MAITLLINNMAFNIQDRQRQNDSAPNLMKASFDIHTFWPRDISFVDIWRHMSMKLIHNCVYDKMLDVSSSKVHCNLTLTNT